MPENTKQIDDGTTPGLVLAKTRDLARLRQATWEATQWLSYDELRGFVDAVLQEIEDDDGAGCA